MMLKFHSSVSCRTILAVLAVSLVALALPTVAPAWSQQRPWDGNRGQLGGQGQGGQRPMTDEQREKMRQQTR